MGSARSQDWLVLGVELGRKELLACKGEGGEGKQH